jgi:glycosyltransferase involved in cell wall biosynthesis
MRFGVVTRYLGFNDGQGRVNFEVVCEAARQGHEVYVFSEEVDPRVLDLERVHAVLSTPPRWIPSRLLRDQLFAIRSMLLLRQPAYRCDALLANGFVTWANSDLNSIHFVHASWRRHFPISKLAGSKFRDAYGSFYALANEWLEKRALRRSKQVVAVSDAVRGELQQLGVSPDRLQVIPNGVDIVEFAPGPSRRAAFGLPEDKVIALFAGDIMTSRKNLDTVLRALSLCPDLYLAVAGKVAGSPYPAMARSMGLQDRVMFLGFRPDVPDLMRSVDLFVLPSRYEPFGLVVLEAMASGLPVLTSRQAGIADCIDQHVGFVLDDCDDAETLAGWLNSLAASPELRREMGACARKLAEAHCWAAMARTYVRLLEKAAELRHAEHA